MYGLPPTPGRASSEEAEQEEDSNEDKLNKVSSPMRQNQSFLDKKLGELTARQWWSVIFFSSFVAFHVLNPLRHFVLYPSNPSWTEEGHFGAMLRPVLLPHRVTLEQLTGNTGHVSSGAWHMKLRTKRGYTLLEIEEKSGRKHVINPEDDPFVNDEQVSC